MFKCNYIEVRQIFETMKKFCRVCIDKQIKQPGGGKRQKVAYSQPSTSTWRTDKKYNARQTENHGRESEREIERGKKRE